MDDAPTKREAIVTGLISMSFFTRLFRRDKLDLSSFALCASRQVLPGLTVRQYAPSDFSACVQLYKDNEPGRFPPGELGRYAEHLDQQRALYLVVEKEGEVVGTGGVHSTYHNPALFYWLSFGLVAPKFHRHGVGTVLLLARIAMLPEPARPWLVGMMCVESSRSFYERFGFRLVEGQTSHPAPVAGEFLALVSARQIRRARQHLSKQRIVLQPDMFRIPLETLETKETV